MSSDKHGREPQSDHNGGTFAPTAASIAGAAALSTDQQHLHCGQNGSKEMDSGEFSSPRVLSSPWELEAAVDSSVPIRQLSKKQRILMMAQRLVRRGKETGREESGGATARSPAPLTPDLTGEASTEDEFQSFKGDIVVPIIEDTGSFYDQDGVYRKREDVSNDAESEDGGGPDDQAVSSQPTGALHPPIPSQKKNERGQKHEQEKNLSRWWKNWKIAAVFGMFWLFFLHEVLSIAVVMTVSSLALKDAVGSFQTKSSDVIAGLAKDNVQVLSDNFQGLRQVLTEQTQNNVSAYIVRTTYPAFSVRDFIRFKKQEFQQVTYTIGVGFDSDGTFFGISANRSNLSIFGQTTPAPDYFMSLPVYTNDPNVLPYCNIPKIFTENNYNVSTPGCTLQAWYYQRCQLRTDQTSCDPSQPLQKITDYNAHGRAWYRAVRELNSPVPAEVVTGTARPGTYPLGAPFWSPVYEYASVSGLGITFGVPIISGSPSGPSTFLGVASSDLYLDNLSSYMRAILNGTVVKNGVAYIMELSTVDPSFPTKRYASGKLIASSDLTEPVLVTPAGRTLVNATDSSNDLIAGSANLVLGTYGTWQNLSLNGTGSYSLDGGPTVPCPPIKERVDSDVSSFCAYVEWKKFEFPLEAGNGLDWALFMVLPDTDFLQRARTAAQSAGNRINALAEDAKDDVQSTLEYTYIVAAVWVLLSGGFAFLISYGLSKPLKVLAGDMLEVAKLKFGHSKPELSSRIREVHEMGLAYLKMREGLEGFARFVPETVVRRIVSGDRKASKLYVTRRNVTVLFSDIKNFTTISESVPLSELIQLLAEYLARMARIVERTQGTVGDFIGDGIMVFWNSPDLVQGHAEKACECALLMQKELDSLNQRWRERGLPAIEIRIGINSGEALSGNIGSPNKMKFGVVGDTVNTASRVENINKYYGTNTLITEATRVRISGFVVRPVDRVRVKGRAGYTELYELVGHQSEASAAETKLSAVTAEAFQLYLHRKFSGALAMVEAALEDYKEDGPLSKLREHCLALMDTPPPANWDGVTTFHDK